MIQRRGTAAEWTAADPVLAAGEIGFETDTSKFKFGDGVTAWSSIEYFVSADALIDGAPALLDTLNEIAAAIGDDASFFTTINNKIDSKANLTIADAVPTTGPDGSEALQEGDLWYDRSNGHIYVYYLVDPGTNTYVWVETGGADSYDEATLGINNHDFPTSPSDGDTHKGFIYDSSRDAWQIDRSFDIDDAANVTITSPSDNHVLMYDSSSAEWINLPGIPLDANEDIPLSFLTLLSDEVDTRGYGKTTVQTEAEWTADTDVPTMGSLNISTGSSIRAKIGDGQNTFDNLEYIPNNTYLAAQIATAISPLAPKADPTFSGTVSLPSTTSIGDVDATEIGYLDGVTSGIQGQLDSLDTLKAPLADPTFTGTVSGITASMVGLSSVDNTADTDKPVSTAQQTALDAKLDLAGGTMTGKITLDGDPTQALHAATKQYVDSAEAGLSTKPQVVAATTGNLAGTYDNGTDGVGATLNLGQLATLDIDGVTSWSLLDGILLKDQTTAAENGRWVVDQIGNGTDTDWILRRCSLCDTADEIPGAYIFVIDGTTNEQTGWVLHVDDPATFTVGTDDIDVYQFAGAGAVTAGTNVSVSGTQISVVDAPVFSGTVDASAAGVEFSDGTQTKAGVPSLTSFTEKTASYTLDTLDHQDNIVEMNAATATTFTIPTDAALAWPVGASMDIFATGTGEVTIAGDTGVTVNATPGLILRTQWSSATILKRGADSWVVYGDLKA